MSEKSTILSVGIDIGTSTTQVIFSQLTFKNSAGYFAVPHIEIADKNVVYKSDIYITPLKDRVMIDGEKVRQIVAGEFSKAGFGPGDTQTGAVIITGESARKENSEIVLNELSDFAGEFVVSTAGPDLESIIAGKGSGAAAYSKENQCTVVNLDIGGGTTNAVLFDCGEVIAKGCLDIGGRLIKVDPDMKVTYVSDSVKRIASHEGLKVQVGEGADYQVIGSICRKMAELLYDWLNHRSSPLLESILTPGSSPFDFDKPIRAICFSGGVADCIYTHQDGPWNRFGDMGILLGDAIRQSRLWSDYRVMEAVETIRATVVGAGSYTTSVSGSTITYDRDVFPLKNIPVLKLTAEEQEHCFADDREWFREKLRWMLEQSDSDSLIVAMKGKQNPSYTELRRMAACLTSVMDEALPPGIPLIIVLEYDMAKALGQVMNRLLEGRRDVICVDSIQVDQNDFVDMGKPLVDGLVIPVVVKTLIFG
ncbi:MAG TPA: ethanolamine ammonia-lyase reactivating factor EutA [Candidatus Onthocola gallistercoris]|uniref:Ethanolamine ammonia-lyase reactivating factor EutA n=1 Tax=Candidatus Onthocola gallistercoris TaxID=2840876 RepID=A0A9D1HIZ6_9FIRM|nr:ethanolamine ammonia-lyase reactivating factor EutA [Candidatus Onthocola gallistercoris]